MVVVKQAVADFRALLEQGGLREALGFLNARTRHRYTGLYRFDPPMLRGVCVFDRENPTVNVGGDAPMRETYCSLVGEGRRPVIFGDAQRDPRVRTHPARDRYLAYCGVPVLLADGRCVGTLCHFDVRPRISPADALALLEGAAGHLAGYVVGQSSAHAPA